jgi:hypothetical protein
MFSIEHDDIPENKKIIRAEVRMFFYLREVEEGVTEVKNIVNLDLKGSIPGFAMSMVSKKQFENIKKLKEICER